MWWFCARGSCVKNSCLDDPPIFTGASDKEPECDYSKKPVTAIAPTRWPSSLDECFCNADPAFLEQLQIARPCEKMHHDIKRVGGAQEKAGAAIQNRALIQEAMATFTRTLQRGVCIEVLLDDGAVLFTETSLNYQLTHLKIEVNEARRIIPVKDIDAVATPRELELKCICTSIQPYLDERCATLVIRDYEFVTFRLDTERHREYFAACLSVLVGRRDDIQTTEASPAPARSENEDRLGPASHCESVRLQR